LRIFSGVSSATFSISTPPSARHDHDASRSRVDDRAEVELFAMSVQAST
jgi:hypothetical protein